MFAVKSKLTQKIRNKIKQNVTLQEKVLQKSNLEKTKHFTDNSRLITLQGKFMTML